MPLIKINNKGKYGLFPGLSVVASIKEKDFTFWQSIYNALIHCDGLTQFYAPLPYQSYHMTALDLFTEHGIGSQHWAHFIEINKNLFNKINLALEEEDYKFEANIEMSHLITKGVIQLVVQVPKKQDNAISELEKRFHLSGAKPQQFHITLAYQYKPICEHDFTALKDQINEKMNTVLKKAPKPLLLDNAKLCYFNDMTAFIPWDVSFYPFNKGSNQVSSSAHSIFNHDKSHDEEKSNAVATLSIGPN